MSGLVSLLSLLFRSRCCRLMFRSSHIFVFWYFGHFSCVIFFLVFFHLAHFALQNVNKKPFHHVQWFSYMDVMTKILGWKFSMIFNWESTLVWTNKKFVYLTFIGQKISYFCHYVHVRKSPDKMKSMKRFKDYIIFLYFRNFIVKSHQKPKTENEMNET